jgi:hypothetical protein
LAVGAVWVRILHTRGSFWVRFFARPSAIGPSFFRNHPARCAFVAPHRSSPRAAQRQCRVVRSVATLYRASICSCARLRSGELPFLPKNARFTATRGPIPSNGENSHSLFDEARRALARFSSRVGAARSAVQPPAAVIGIGCEHARLSGNGRPFAAGVAMWCGRRCAGVANAA